MIRTRLKGLAALTLALVMMLSMVTVSWGATATKVKIGNIELNSSTPYLVNGDTAATNSPTGYNAYFNATKGTLTLNNFYLTNSRGINAEGNLTIELEGTGNSIAVSSDNSCYGIRCAGALTIKGTGSLHIVGTPGASGGTAVGIQADSITVEAGNVNATGGDYGIGADNITVEGGNVSATGGDYGIEAEIFTIAGGNVTATGGDCGIEADSFTSSGGDVTATGDYYGIYTATNVAISGGTVTSYGGLYGIDTDIITITGGTVDASAGSSTTANHTYGVFATSVDVNGGSLKATAASDVVNGYNSIALQCSDTLNVGSGNLTIADDGNGNSPYCGIYSKGVNISGGEVNVSAGSVAMYIIDGDIVISSGIVNVTGDWYGIEAVDTSNIGKGNVTISGGIVNANAGDSNGTAIYSYAGGGTGTISIKNSTVTAGCETGLDATNISIENSTVTIDAAVDAINCNSLSFGSGWQYQWTGNKAEQMKHVTFDLTAYNSNPTAYLKFAPYTVTPTPPGNYYPIYTPPVEEPVVESATTFDTGVALPLAIAILGATGSAWLLKKKDEE